MTFCVETNDAKTVEDAMYDEWLGGSGASAHITYKDCSMKSKMP